MTKELWINLPVKDIKKSKAFFTAIGFSLNTKFGDGNDAASFLVGEKKMNIMLFPEATFQSFSQQELADTRKGTEVLFSFDGESREEVDEMAEKVAKAGGVIFSKPSENQGWMYGFAFADPDGHRWNMLYMDLSKMPGRQ